MARALIVYATRKGETRKIGDYIAEGLRFSGVEVTVMNAADIAKAEEIDGFDAYIFGAPTYHGEMIPAMKTFLFLAEKADLAGKVGGAFGAFGWSGESPDRILDTMQHVFGMETAAGPLRLKSSGLGGGVQMAQDYGRKIAGYLPEG